MPTIPQNSQLLKELIQLIEKSRSAFGQQRVYEKAVWMMLAEIVLFARHTVTQMLLSIGRAEQDWSSWYRLFSCRRFNYDKASEVLFQESLHHVGDKDLYVVAGDGTQTRRSSRKMEGAHWLHNPQSPVFKRGIHIAQRWFNGSWLLPAENGYSRAVPIRWLPAFTEKSLPETTAPQKEWECAVAFLLWIRVQLAQAGRQTQRLLMVADGSYDTLNLWKHLPAGVILIARSAKNRVLYTLPASDARRNRKYGERAASPQQQWRVRTGWQRLTLTVRGRDRHLRVKVSGPYLRKGAAQRPLFLILVGGKVVSGRQKRRRPPLPFLVNAVLDDTDQWQLPLPVEQLLFWTWQRWEVEVAHRELKSNFGLGNKQCWSPHAAVLSVQWSAWVYSLLLLAGYRTWSLTGSPQVPTRWWRGSGRWSLNTLWRGFRAALWGEHVFHPLPPDSLATDTVSYIFRPILRHAAFASARS